MSGPARRGNGGDSDRCRRPGAGALLDFGRGPIPDLSVLVTALRVLPESERFMFARAIAARAAAWRGAPAGSAPAPCPATVRIAGAPSLADGDDVHGDSGATR